MSTKYNSTERENWMKSIQPNYSNQTWQNDQVFHPSDIKYVDFFKRKEINRRKINPKNIHGLEYAYAYNCPSRYSNMKIDWIYMLHSLKRLDWVIDNFKTKEELVNHIHTDEDTKAVLQYGNHYFTISGQHRLCLAKFLEVSEVEVNIHKYELDRGLFIREKRVEKYFSKLIDYKIIDKSYSNDIDNEYLYLKIQEETIFLHKKFVIYVINRYELLEKRRYKSISNILKGLLKPVNNNNFFKKEEELYLLDLQLIKHIKSTKRHRND